MNNNNLDTELIVIFANTVMAYANHFDGRVIITTGTMSSVTIHGKSLPFYFCNKERAYWDAAEEHLTNNAFVHWKSSSVFELTTDGQLQAELFTEQNNIDFTQDLKSTLKELTGGVLFGD